jgi:hypothetical protein
LTEINYLLLYLSHILTFNLRINKSDVIKIVRKRHQIYITCILSTWHTNTSCAITDAM